MKQKHCVAPKFRQKAQQNFVDSHEAQVEVLGENPRMECVQAASGDSSVQHTFEKREKTDHARVNTINTPKGLSQA